MASDSNTVYVITGANRGIGLGLVKSLLTRPSTTVIATVRNEDAATSLLSELIKTLIGEKSGFEIVKLDFSAALPLEQIRSAFTTDRIDVLINNAGWSPPMTLATQTSAADLRAAFEINTIGPLTVFQALWPLLRLSPTPKLINMTSSVGCITYQEAPGGAYGPSKAALHEQNEGLVAVALHPGWVQTRMGEGCAKDWGFEGGPPETVEGSVEGVLEIVDGATRERWSGKFVTYKGQELPW